MRNTLCHSPKPEIVKTDFDNYVQLVISSLTAVGVDTSFVYVIGQMSEDDFPTEKIQELQNDLEAVSVLHENMEQKLSAIDERTDEMHKMMKNISLQDKENIKGAVLYKCIYACISSCWTSN